MKNIKTIGVIGAGNMGEALIGRIGFIKKIIASDKNKAQIKYIKKKYRINIGRDNSFVAKNSNPIILAVKPKDVDEVLFEIRPYLKNKLLISIAAGVSTVHLEKISGKIRVVRVMPNLGCLVGFGVSAISKGNFATSKDIETVKKIFSLIGEVIVVREALIDSITAISGSGPAYYFLLTESLRKAAMKLGLKKDLAEQLAISTLYSSGRLIKSAEISPEKLIRKVASKGGTTEAALAVFKEKGFEGIVEKAVRAAKNRAISLSR